MGEQGWNVTAYTCACHPGVMWGIGGDIGPTLSSSPEAADASTFWYGVGAWTAGPAADARTFVGLDDLRAAHPDLTPVAVDNVAALLADHARVVRELDEQRQRAEAAEAQHRERIRQALAEALPGRDCGHDLEAFRRQAQELVKARTEIERLRERIHAAVVEADRRYAPYVSRCAQFDRWSVWAREQFEKAGDPVSGYNYWQMTSEANRLLCLSWLEQRDEAVAAHGRVVAKLTGLERDLVTARATVAEEIAAAIERHPGVTTHGRRALAGVARRHAVEGAPDPGPTPPIQGPDEPAYFAATPEGGTDV